MAVGTTYQVLAADLLVVVELEEAVPTVACHVSPPHFQHLLKRAFEKGGFVGYEDWRMSIYRSCIAVCGSRWCC
jgi:hypothetical protein